MAPNVIEIAIPFFLLAIVLEAGFSAYFKKNFYRLNDAVSDISCGIVFELTGLFTKFITIGIFAYVQTHYSLQHFLPLPSFPSGGPFDSITNFLACAGAFIAVDFAYYWLHRTSHECNILWAGHVVHHSSEEYNLTVALRQSSLHGLFSWVFYIPLALLGMPWQVFTVCYGLNLIYQFWIHTRLIGKLGPFEYLFNTPSHHRVHHGVNPKYLDKNHAGVFMIWDRMFGTFQEEEEEPVYGLTVPLDSWNPVWANVHVFRSILEDLPKAPTFSDKLKIIFGKPGWKPAALGPSITPREVSVETYHKFDPPVPSGQRIYGLFQFIPTLALALWVLDNKAMDIYYRGLWTAAVVLSLVILGGLFENKRLSFLLERAKHIALLILSIGFAFYFNNYILGGAIFAYAILSLFLVTRFFSPSLKTN